jgi:exodeoxyribonuclease-3
MPLKITTWNINSVRLRIDLVAKFLKSARPDVLCLQETKCPDDAFPLKRFTRLGYEHAAINGQKGYHGVAVLSRVPFEHVDVHSFCGKTDCRHISVVLGERAGLQDPLTLHNFYVPAGGDVPDREANPKYAHKLDFVAEATTWFAARTALSRAVLVGDLNIAPLEHDVWNHKQLLGVVSHTPPETAGLTAWMQQGFDDAVRHFVPADRKLYTWWSYRNSDWRASDRGRRLDHIWVSRDLTDGLQSQTILKDARDWPQPSDHVPVCVELEV